MRDVTFSCWINAWSIDQGLRKLDGRKLYSTKPDGLIKALAQEPNKGDVLYFTDEASMRKYIGQKDYFSVPKQLPEGVFDDKLAFASLARELGIPTIPFQNNPCEQTKLAFPVLVKARNSWINGKHVHRGWVCESRQEFPQVFKEIEEKGLQSSDYFLQEWLEEVAAEDNYSVCGYWDAEENDRNLLAVVRRTSSYNKGQSCSSAIAVIQDPGELIEWTRTILNHLSYSGPFEIEYLRTRNGFRVLEFNPRFWYQNGIFLKHGNGLIRRYLEIDEKTLNGETIIDSGTWVDAIWFLRSILKLQFQAIREVRRAAELGRAKVDLYPTIPVALKYFLRRIFSGKPPE